MSLRLRPGHKPRRVLIPGLLGLALAGCATVSGPAGDPTLYTALGDEDVALAAAALQESLETTANGTATAWQNAASGHAGSITPRETSIAEDGRFCRLYDERLELADGRSTTLAHTACRDPEGRWVWLED